MGERPKLDELKLRKLQLIFAKFDDQNAGRLSKEGVENLMKTVNPGFPLNQMQLDAIQEEIWEEYREHTDDRGLSMKGLEQIYIDGLADIDSDFLAANLTLSNGFEDTADTVPMVQQKNASSIHARTDSEAASLGSLSAGAISVAPKETEASPNIAQPESLNLQAPVSSAVERKASGAESLPEVQEEALEPAYDAMPMNAYHSEGIRSEKSMDSFSKQGERYGKGDAGLSLPLRQNSNTYQPETRTKGIETENTRTSSLVKGLKGRLEKQGGGVPSLPTSPVRAAPAISGVGKVAMLVQSLEVASPVKTKGTASPAKRDPVSRGAVPRGPKLLTEPFRGTFEENQLPGQDRLHTDVAAECTNSSAQRPLLTGPSSQVHSRFSPPTILDSDPVGSGSKAQYAPDLEPITEAKLAASTSQEAHFGMENNTLSKSEGLAQDDEPERNQAGLENAVLHYQRGRPQTSLQHDGSLSLSRQNIDNAVSNTRQIDSQSSDGTRKQRSGIAEDGKEEDEFNSGKHGLGRHHRITDSRSSDMENNIQAYKHIGVPDLGAYSDDERDNIYDEVETATGILKFPSAVSIEAKGFSKQTSSSCSHSRGPSAVEDLSEAAKARNLKIFIPPETSKAVFHDETSAICSPGSSTIAERDAQVGYESLDSPIASGSHFQRTPKRTDLAEDINTDIQTLVQSKPQEQHLPLLRQRIRALGHERKAYTLHVELGRKLAKWQCHKEAAKCFEEACSYPQADAVLYFRLGNCLFALDQLDAAEEAFRQGLQLNEGSGKDSLTVKIITNLGIAQEARGLLVGACDSYRKASILTGESSARILKLLGGGLYAAGNHCEAKAALEQALSLQPNYPDALCDLGCTLGALGDSSAAKRAFYDTIDQDQGHCEAWFNVANVERKDGQYKEALHAYQTVLSLKPQHWRAKLLMAVTLIGLKRPAEAQTTLKEALHVSGQAGKVTQEVSQLRRLACYGGTQEQLTRAAISITQKTNDVPSPLPKGYRLRNNVAATSMERSRSMEDFVAAIDMPLLRELSAFATVPTEQIVVACRSACQRQLSPVEVEVLCRDLLPDAKPRAFCNLMKSLQRHVLPQIQAVSTARPGVDRGCLDGSILAILLLAISQGSWNTRAGAMMAIICQYANRDGREKASVYIAAIKAIFGIDHDVRPAHTSGFDRLVQPEDVFSGMTDPVIGFPPLPALPKLAHSG